MKFLVVIILFIYNITAQQINSIYNVPESFKEKYDSLQYNFNPLHVGDVWQYYFEEYDKYCSTRILQDSIINGKQYFKKVDWQRDFYYWEGGPEYISWERNDTTNGNTYMLDFEDIDSDGDTLEEFLIDSLALETGSRYINYKYMYKGYYDYLPRTTYVYGTQWVEIWGDTVLLKQTEIEELFQQEDIADKFGIVGIIIESPYRPLVGAIINGKQYGTIVSVETENNSLSNFHLFQNYPNPFNPETNIEYSLNETLDIKIHLYDTLGRKIAVLYEGQKQPGKYKLKLNADELHLASSVYFCTMINKLKSKTIKVLYMR